MKRAAVSVLTVGTVVLAVCGTNDVEGIKADAAPVANVLVDNPADCDNVSCDLPKKSACPEDMVEIDGEYCPKDDARCLYWVDSYGKRTNIDTDRCGEWRKPVHCLVKTKHMHYCISKFEYSEHAGGLPRDWLSFNEAEKIAAAQGKRLCKSSEWMMAALGQDNHPVPYGDGFHRAWAGCNIDRHISEVGLVGAQVMSVKDPNSDVAQRLRSLLVPADSQTNCCSDYNVCGLAGNIDELVINESGRPYKSGLVGGMTVGVRNRSRAITVAHSPNFYWYETGTRFCADADASR